MSTKRNFSAEEAKQRFDSLPQNIKEAIYSAEMEEALSSVGNKYRLHIDQLSILEAEVSAMLLGFTEPKDFQEIVEERLHLSSAESKDIVENLNTQFFEKIRGSLKQESEQTQTVAEVPKLPSVVDKSVSLPMHTTVTVPKTVEVSLPEEKKGPSFKADPYREPIE